ncbi:unnamed protein product [Acanthoscelides obtectus]|uniref:Uncharacterized protein n=1 Tax=Acanthoscelides obtectus TaxID=200917 RepID=A0A9P0PSC2_ACAOB|nr:unnamed protein product [Acanthoscelides obtectus]CAK1620034.1 hypothetical protein AOBTE_LOCUS150 [Acanthoscelides obtectus]
MKKIPCKTPYMSSPILSSLTKIRIVTVNIKHFCEEDAFKRRGEALENLYMRKHNARLLKALRAEVQEMRTKRQKTEANKLKRQLIEKSESNVGDIGSDKRKHGDKKDDE